MLRNKTLAAWALRGLIVVLCTVTLVRQLWTQPVSSDPETMTLLWFKAYDAESKEAVETGLKWVFLNLGAKLPRGSFARSTEWTADSRIVIHFSGLGFSEQALHAISALNAYLQDSAEYRSRNGIDIGKYVMLTMNSSNHYYAITGAERHLALPDPEYRMDPKLAVIPNSAVALNGRLVELPDATVTGVMRARFIAHTGSGELKLPSFKAQEYETIQVMDNGQLRFAIYGSEGNLNVASNPALGNAGKPSKCLWCHEIHLQPTHTPSPDGDPSFYTVNEFNGRIGQWTGFIDSLRSKLVQDVDFTHKEDHAYAELLYLTFMEPSAARLAGEWGISVAEVKDKLWTLTTHHNPEHASLGDLYDRKDVDVFSAFKPVQFPASAREQSAFEPSYIPW